MAYRVVQWGTGNVGAHAIAGIDKHPELELVGLWVSSPSKVGKDAGELAGINRKLGVAATNDVEALLALKPDCIVYTAASDSRPVEAIGDYERFLRAEVNVVASGPVSAIWPQDEGFAALNRAAVKAGKTVWVNGLDPGFANDFVPIMLTGLCRSVSKLHCIEIFNYASYNQPDTLRSMGFGMPADFVPRLSAPGQLTRSFAGGLHQLAAGLGIKLDSIKEHCERVMASESFSTVTIPIEKGTGAGIRFSVTGVKDGKDVVVIEHVTRMSENTAPEWPQPSGHGCYRISVEGDPSFTLDLQMDDDHDDHVNAACLATAMRIINAVPAVVEARPGHISIYDLPLITGNYLPKT